MTKRRAFTLIELLVVVGIIAALAAMFTVGIKALSGKAAADSTRVLLQNCRSMISELRASVGNNRPLPMPTPVAGDTTTLWEWPTNTKVTVSMLTSSNSGLDFWNIGYGSRTSPRAMPAPTNIHSNDITLMPAFRNTHRAMQLLGRCPNNRSGLTKLPADRQVSLKDLTLTGTPSADALFQKNDLPILRDAWNNPIIYCPAAGFGPVYLNDKKMQRIVRSSGLYASGDAALNTIGPNDRPFFISAGPDGDFALGDDNLYSFQD